MKYWMSSPIFLLALSLAALLLSDSVEGAAKYVLKIIWVIALIFAISRFIGLKRNAESDKKEKR